MKYTPDGNDCFLMTNVTGRAYYLREANQHEYTIAVYDYKNAPIKNIEYAGASIKMYGQIRNLLTEAYWISSPK